MTKNVTDDALDGTNDQAKETADDTAPNDEQAERRGGTNAPTGSGSIWSRLLRSTWIRIVGVVLIAVILIVIIGSVVYSSTRAQRGQKLPVDIYPNAVLVAKHDQPNSDSQTYSTKDPFQAVYAFYADRIKTDDSGGCKKVYLTLYPTPTSEEPGKVAGKCIVYNNFQDADQSLAISLQTQMDASGKPGLTLIVIERSWKG